MKFKILLALLLMDVFPAQAMPRFYDSPVSPNTELVAVSSSSTCVASPTEMRCFGELFNAIPRHVTGFEHIRQMVLSSDNVCVLDEERVFCYGNKDNGILNFPRLDHPRKLTLNQQNACVLDGENLICWGNKENIDGDDGVVKSVTIPLHHPTDLASYDNTLPTNCVLDDNGVKCWAGDFSRPIQILPPLKTDGHFILGSLPCVQDAKLRHCWNNDDLIRAKFKVQDFNASSNFYWAEKMSQSSCEWQSTGLICKNWNQEYFTIPNKLLGKDVSLAVEADHFCALQPGNVRCWGNNDEDQSQFRSPLALQPGRMAVGIANTCQVIEGELHCWGSNFGNLNSPPTGLADAEQISLGSPIACALVHSQAKCWGENASQATRILNSFGKLRRLFLGSGEGAALTNSSLHYWMGNETKKIYEWSAPGMQNVLDIQSSDIEAALEYQTRICLLKKESVWCWNPTTRQKVRHFSNLKNARSFTVGSEEICVLDDSGVHCKVSKNGDRELKNIPSLNHPTQLVADRHENCVLDRDGVKCWGFSNQNQIEMPKLLHPRQIAAGYEHICAVDDEGIKCWGDDTDGEVSLGRE